MKSVIQIGAALLPFMTFTGCLAIKMTEPSEEKMQLVSETTQVVRSELSGIEPSAVRKDNVVAVKVNLLGKFKTETKKVYASSLEHDDYLAVGFFPGVMSCKGEYRDCVQNGAGALLFNLAFAGLPTVYGILVEPFVPHYPNQTDSIVGRKAFLKSALIGFSRYSKPAERKERVQASHSEVGKLPLEDAVITATELGITSERGLPLFIPVDRLPSSGDVRVKLSLPDDHPLKSVISDLEDVPIEVSCQK